MKPTYKPKQGITIHRDGTVSYWSVYRNVWDRVSARELQTRYADFQSLSDQDRIRVMAAFKRAHPVLQSFHSGKWGWRRVGDCLDLRSCVFDTKRGAELDRSEAARTLR
jgi:hypothetical protein